MALGNIKKVGLWVKIYDVPLEYLSKARFSHIASGLARPRYVNSITNEGNRLDFMKVCVEMVVEESFLDFIDLSLLSGENMELRVEYNWK